MIMINPKRKTIIRAGRKYQLTTVTLTATTHPTKVVIQTFLKMSMMTRRMKKNPKARQAGYTTPAREPINRDLGEPDK